MPSRMRPSLSKMVLAFVVLSIIWSSTWLVIKEGLRDLPPFSAAAYRFTLASASFAAVSRWLLRLEGGERPPWRISLVLGLSNFTVGYGIVYFVQTKLPSGLSSVLWAVFPMMMALLAHYWLPGERLTVRRFAGFALGFLGVAVLFAIDLSDLGTGALGYGGLLLLSPLSAAIGQTTVKRYGQGGQVSSTLLNRDSMWIGAVMLWAAALTFEQPFSVTWTTGAVVSVVYLALPGTVVTFGLYYWLLRYAPANKLSTVTYITPVAALSLGWAFAGEPLGVSTGIGTALILLGVTLVMRAERRGQSRPEESGAA